MRKHHRVPSFLIFDLPRTAHLVSTHCKLLANNNNQRKLLVLAFSTVTDRFSASVPSMDKWDSHVTLHREPEQKSLYSISPTLSVDFKALLKSPIDRYVASILTLLWTQDLIYSTFHPSLPLSWRGVSSFHQPAGQSVVVNLIGQLGGLSNTLACCVALNRTWRYDSRAGGRVFWFVMYCTARNENETEN